MIRTSNLPPHVPLSVEGELGWIYFMNSKYWFLKKYPLSRNKVGCDPHIDLFNFLF
jgi:hypothetical protein